MKKWWICLVVLLAGVARAEYAWQPVGDGFNNIVYALDYDPITSRVYAGGLFSFSGAEQMRRMAWLNPGQSSWNELMIGSSGDSVRTIAAGGDSNIYVGGVFEYHDWTKVNGLLQIVDAQSGAFATLGGELPYTAIKCLCWDPNGYVYAGVQHLYEPMEGYYGIKRWDGIDWSRLTSAGFTNVVDIKLDPSSGHIYFLNTVSDSSTLLKYDGSNVISIGTVPSTSYECLAIDSSGNVYCGGRDDGIEHMSIDPPISNIAKWTGTEWADDITGLRGIVHALATDGSNIYAGGTFSIYGINGQMNKIAKWDGSAWYPLSTGMNGSVRSLAYDTDRNILYAGGDFTSAGGQAASRIARWVEVPPPTPIPTSTPAPIPPPPTPAPTPTAEMATPTPVCQGAEPLELFSVSDCRVANTRSNSGLFGWSFRVYTGDTYQGYVADRQNTWLPSNEVGFGKVKIVIDPGTENIAIRAGDALQFLLLSEVEQTKRIYFNNIWSDKQVVRYVGKDGSTYRDSGLCQLDYPAPAIPTPTPFVSPTPASGDCLIYSYGPWTPNETVHYNKLNRYFQDIQMSMGQLTSACFSPDFSIGGNYIEANAIGATQLKTDSVVTKKIKDLSVTSQKLEKDISIQGTLAVGPGEVDRIHYDNPLFSDALPVAEFSTGTYPYSYSDLVTLRHSGTSSDPYTRRLGFLMKMGDEESEGASLKSGGMVLESKKASSADPSLSLVTAGAKRMVINSEGNIGVGFSNHTATRFGVSGQIAGVGALRLAEHQASGVAYLDARDDESNKPIGLKLRTQCAGATSPSLREVMFLTQTGDVGIGISSPTAKLDVNGSGKFAGDLDVVGDLTANDLSVNDLSITGKFTALTDIELSGNVSKLDVAGDRIRIRTPIMITESLTQSGKKGDIAWGYHTGAGYVLMVWVDDNTWKYVTLNNP